MHRFGGPQYPRGWGPGIPMGRHTEKYGEAGGKLLAIKVAFRDSKVWTQNESVEYVVRNNG